MVLQKPMGDTTESHGPNEETALFPQHQQPRPCGAGLEFLGTAAGRGLRVLPVGMVGRGAGGRGCFRAFRGPARLVRAARLRYQDPTLSRQSHE
jgi:hypothetical protein